MNYLIESSFLNSETFGTLLWAEKMLSNFVAASDDKLGLNKCSAAEKKVMRVLSKSFQVEFVETSGKTFLQKTSDSRCPFLTINDYLTPDKIEAHFPTFKTKFQSNVSSFPTKYKPYQSMAVQREDLPRVNQKPTNKEVSQHEQSQRSMHSRGSSMSSESNAQISPHLLKSSVP
jgi:hypothetical protein